MKRLTLCAATLVATLSAAAAPYQYSTPVPPGIAAPKEMPTRFGTLKFFDGVPDLASTQKIFDNLDFQRAMQGYLLGLPAVNQLAKSTNILDLRNGPLVLEVPPKVRGLIDDMGYRWNTDLGITGPDEGAGGKYLLLPTGKANNWVQTIPGKAWFTILRLYGPLEPWFKKTWRPDDIRLVK